MHPFIFQITQFFIFRVVFSVSILVFGSLHALASSVFFCVLFSFRFPLFLPRTNKIYSINVQVLGALELKSCLQYYDENDNNLTKKWKNTAIE